MKLYGYWRSSATYRVRIALALKGVTYDYEPVDLLAGEQKTPAYLDRNPTGLVPSLETDDGDVIVQSMAIIDYLEEVFPAPSLFPADPIDKAQSRAMALSLVSEAQPFMNLRVQNYVKNDAGLGAVGLSDWLNKWVGGTMKAVETLAADYYAKRGGAFLAGDAPTVADCCLVPQMFGAMRFGVDVSAMPRLNEVFEHCNTLEAFEKAHPKNQPDAPDA
ncbi:MAG: maleylacetoacetate isomerase [Pseudomonadota bacterium]